MKKEPIIIIGMHRSGTTMISKFLEDSGVFMGVNKEINNESIFFLHINNWMFKQANAYWDLPYSMNLLSGKFKSEIIIYLNRFLTSPYLIRYLGFKNYLKYRNLKNIDFLWGWKDPRNTFTLELWKKIFPNSKIVHIYRNPIDVSNSLKKREGKYLLKNSKKFFYFGKISNYSVRVSYLSEGIKLWEEYLKKVFNLEKNLEKPIFHLKYENFLQNPYVEFKNLLDFLEIDLSNEKLKKIVKNVNKNRSYAFLNDRILVEKYLKIKNKPLIKKLGYNRMI